MDPVSAKLIGAGIACIGMGGAGVGVGIIFGNFLQGALRNPTEAPKQFGNLIFGFAVTEALGIFSLAVAPILLYAKKGSLVLIAFLQAGAAHEAGGEPAGFPPFDPTLFSSQ